MFVFFLFFLFQSSLSYAFAYMFFLIFSLRPGLVLHRPHTAPSLRVMILLASCAECEELFRWKVLQVQLTTEFRNSCRRFMHNRAAAEIEFLSIIRIRGSSKPVVFRLKRLNVLP
jgi:hypothetical protein